MIKRSPTPPTPFQQPGTFTVGCNYWASHAGTAMWQDWRPDIIRTDLTRLAKHGISVLRVFPLWPDFQPIKQLYTHGGEPYEIRHGEEPLPTDGPLKHGVCPIMLARLDELCSIAAELKIDLIVALVTGWMSGRLFVPDALAGRDPITDPLSLMWQTRLVRTLVQHAAPHPAILAWDLGNECNCMGKPASRQDAYLWTSNIASTIRAADPSRPIISGMHALSSSIARIHNTRNPWTLEDQGELTDILTTHPYPYWTRHTRIDPVDAFRTTHHATAETRFYADLSGKPAIAEEIGSMGPMIASDEASANFARVNLFSLWANDCRAFLWWCNHDQHHLTHAPYDWIGVELELGLLRADNSPKPVLRELAAFRDFRNSLDFTTLPRRRTDAICLLSHNIDDWAIAYSTHILAKQAHLNIDFRTVEQSIPHAPIYLLPCIKGPNPVPRRVWSELLQRVHNGATLYLSIDDGILPHFNEIAGVQVQARASRTETLQLQLTSPQSPDSPLPIVSHERILLHATSASVLGHCQADGLPLFTRSTYGKGHVFVVAAPLELSLTQNPHAFSTTPPANPTPPPFWHIYRHIAQSARPTRILQHTNPHLATTEHTLPDGRTLLIAINHSPTPQTLCAHLPDGITPGPTLRARRDPTPDPHTLSLTIPPFDAALTFLDPSPTPTPTPPLSPSHSTPLSTPPTPHPTSPIHAG